MDELTAEMDEWGSKETGSQSLSPVSASVHLAAVSLRLQEALLSLGGFYVKTGQA